MDNSAERAIAIVGLGAILPDAPSPDAFWQNIVNKVYSIQDVPPERWNPEDYYNPDPTAPDKTYSKIGGWVQGYEFDWRRFRMPPKVVESMDQGQQWAVSIAAEALDDYGYPQRPLDTDRTAVILGTAMGGELHYETNLRIFLPEYVHYLESVDAFEELPLAIREAILQGFHASVDRAIPPITEDSMPGELPNIVSGRVANMLNLRGPNFITDAACASSFAAVEAAMQMLTEHKVDAVLTGGVDRNMGVTTFVKFCKIGALSATGSRPFGDGADGFVMGEGSGAFLLKRLEDAERSGDKIYAVIRGVGGASDGKGKGITAPNPIGQQLAMRRAWETAGLDPATATLIEAHGTSTRVGDAVELESLATIFGGAPRQSIALGSAKSNIGHLKAGAGAAGLLKATMALYHKILPPTLNAEKPNPNFDFSSAPFFVNHEAREWALSNGGPRRAGVSAYGFGGTNFHIVLEEYVPGMLAQKKTFAAATIAEPGTRSAGSTPIPNSQSPIPDPLRGILAIGADTPKELKEKLDNVFRRVENGWTPPIAPPDQAELAFGERLVIDYGDHVELRDRLGKAQKALGFDTRQAWQAMQAQGIFRGRGPAPGKLTFLFPGQGSQYINMGRELAEAFPIVAGIFEKADQIMEPILGKSLTDYIYIDSDDPGAVMQAELDLMQTEITQPAMLTLDEAIYQLLRAYGFEADMVMGHSLGEYAALVAAGIMPFEDSLEAAAARGSEMAQVSVDDNGKMAAVLAPYEVVVETLKEIDGYVVPANINSQSQCVIGGASEAVEAAVELFEEREHRAILLPVSHAFHTRIVAPASAPLRQVLNRLRIAPPHMPIVANLTGEFYPTGVEAIKDVLEQQIASPVQWVKGLETLYDAGVRTFVEVGPKRALRGFVNDVFQEKEDVVALITNHPKYGELATFNQALCGLYAAGYGTDTLTTGQRTIENEQQTMIDGRRSATYDAPPPVMKEESMAPSGNGRTETAALNQLLSQLLQQTSPQAPIPKPYDRNETPLGSVVISGAGLGLPGAEKSVMDPDNAMRILRGEQFVDLIPERFRRKMVDKRITRLIKSADGSGSFEPIDDTADVIKLAGRPGSFDLTEEYGVPEKLVEALDITTQLAIAAGIDALREAGIPLVQTYRRTTTGKHLPQNWVLPEALRDETGVIFASAFPGGNRFAEEFSRYFTWQNRLDQRRALEDLRQYTTDGDTLREINRRIGQLREAMEREPYTFDRRFLFRILSMGHSQFAQHIGARGPNTQVNAACASTAQAIAIAEDWIRNGRCRRVVVIGGDDVTGDHMLEWVGAGFLAVGAATIEDRVSQAALPFDRRRHGTILGMGACGLVVESEDAVRERGMRGIVELLSSETRNSAFHGTRLDVEHIAMVMDNLVTAAERRFGVHRQAMAAETVFMSHETYTPARGGSASAEVVALRETFGEAAGEIIIANTKGFTGHAMGVGVEDVIAVKILEYGIVPPVPNFQEVDPDLGRLNLSRGGRYPVKYAIHLAAGFGSQIALTLTRRIPGNLDRVDNRPRYQRWLDDVSGYDGAELEVEKRTLRVKAEGPPQRSPAPSQWQYGTGPIVRAPAAGGDGGTAVPQPARMRYEPIQPSPQPVKAAPPPKPAPAPVRPEATPVVSDGAEERRGMGEEISPRPQAATPQPLVTAGRRPPAQKDSVADKVLSIVAEQTGYPPDMLDRDLDMEADLGIDTVKQAETFAAIRQAFDIPRRDDLSLRDYNTLEKVIGFVYEMRPDLSGGAEGQRGGGEEISPRPQVVAPTLPSPPTAVDGVAQKVLDIVAEQTGYPPDMLDRDLDMEADLGIDTVKQAETFAAIRQAFDIPRRDDLSLRDYNTLEKVIGFVYEMRPDLSGGAEGQRGGGEEISPRPQVAAPQLPSTPAQQDGVAGQVLAIVAEQTGYPPEMLELDLDLEADLGIDTVKQAETFAAIRQTFDIPRRDDLSLRDYNTLEKVIGFVYEMRPDLGGGAEEQGGTGEKISPRPQVAAPQLPSSPAQQDGVAGQVLAIVAEQTGYPPEMLELDLDLEADLGIDTVKQAETFAAIRQTFDIPRRDDLSLRDYNTLEKVIGFVYDMRPELGGGAEGRPAVGQRGGGEEEQRSRGEISPAPQPLVIEGRRSPAQLSDADAIPRRVPTPTLRPSLDLCRPTGVTLDENSRVIVMMDGGGVGRSLVNRLEKLGATPLTIDEPLPAEELQAQIESWLADGPIQGVYWLPALDVEPAVEEMAFDQWRELNRIRVKNLYTTMRALYDAIDEAGTFLVSATRLGGRHGYGPDGATAPLGGAVSGFTKAYKREKGDALVKVVDFTASRKTAAPADALIAETLTDPGVVEIGYPDEDCGPRFSVTLLEIPADGGGMTLDGETIFVVTGAAGGITSAIVADLAAASGGTFYLLDLVEAPAADDAKVALFRQDKEALKNQLIEEAKAAGERPTPVLIEKQLMALERSEAALRAIESVEAAGGVAHYRAVNLLDHEAVTAVVEEISDAHGRIDVLIHAGGLEISKALDEKPAEQFNLVFDVKADGFFSLLKAAADLPLGATVAFSSVAGRFGNSGQTDYSAANDLLCKLTSSLRRRRPETRGIAIDWSAWGGIGMATRGSIPRIMEMAGIEMLPPEVGIPTVRRELVAGPGGEIVVGGTLGILTDEWDETGGVDPAQLAEAGEADALLMIGQIKAHKLYGGLEVETTLDPNAQPFLYDHAMDGTPLLPGVMGTEAFAELASLAAPGYAVAAVEDEDFHAPFKFYRMEPQTLHLSATAVPDGDDLLVYTALRSVRELATGQQEKLHFTAIVRMTKDKPQTAAIPFTPPSEFEIGPEAIYNIYFHGPAYQVLAGVSIEGERAIGLLAADLPPNADPADMTERIAPRLVELCFQTAGVWEIKTKGQMALPLAIGSVTAYRQEREADAPGVSGRLFAIVQAVDGGAAFNAQVVDEAGQVYVDLQGYRTVQLPGSVQL